jgi:transcriptional regulator with XRE-family HTH domain
MVIVLADLRRKASVTQMELATALGTSQGQISRLEGQRDMLLSTLGAYLAALGVDAKIVVEVGEQTVTYELTAGRGIDERPDRRHQKSSS